MSDFPVSGARSEKESISHNRALLGPMGDPGWTFAVAKEKGGYVYDLDANKYSDFHLHDGTVVIGHNPPSVTGPVKNAISGGMASGFVSKLLRRPALRLLQLSDYPRLSFFPSREAAFSRLIASYSPAKVAVNTRWLKTLLASFFPHLPVEIPPWSGRYGLALLEPAEMDADLSDTRFGDCPADIKVSVEDRTAFRLKPAFLASRTEADHLVSSRNIAGGMDVAAVFSRLPFPQGGIAAYQAAAMRESLTLLLQGGEVKGCALPFEHPFALARRGSVIRLAREVSNFETLDAGVILSGCHAFLCREHTEYDLKRLRKALDRLGN